MEKNKPRIESRYVFLGDAESVIIKYLRGELASREAGALLGCSHQNLLNLVAKISKQWVMEGKLILKQ